MSGFERSVMERVEAELVLESLTAEQQHQAARLDRARTALGDAQSTANTQVQRRTQLKASLDAVTKRWLANPTEQNLTALTEQITDAACDQKVTAHGAWKTTPTLGALIYYQTKRARERGDRPESISNPTETKQAVCIGRYYVWSERGGKVTSDRERLLFIGQATASITVVEDR